MTIAYDEIVIKYIEGKLIPGFDWIIKQLESDPEVVAGTNRNKENLRRFLQAQVDELDEFVKCEEDDRDNQDDTDIFGDDDIVTSPISDLDEDSDDFMNPPDPNKPDWLNDDGDDEDDTMPGW